MNNPITLYFEDGTYRTYTPLPDTPANRQRIADGDDIVLMDDKHGVTTPNGKYVVAIKARVTYE